MSRPKPRMPALGAPTLAMTLALLGGCATFSDDGGFDHVRTLASERIGQRPDWPRTTAAQQAARDRSAELLATPLTADTAVELALLNSPSLQASYQSLGIAEADLVRAGRLRNPGFSFTDLRNRDGDYKIERGLLFDLVGLLTLPTARRVEQQRFEQAQYQAAADTVALAAEVRRAYYAALACTQLADYAQQVNEAAELSGELAQRLAQAGNLSRLAQLRQKTFHAESVARLARVRQQCVAARERLLRRLGLINDDGLRLPPRLPDLPDTPFEPHDAEQTAIDRRLDVLQARQRTEQLAQSLGLTRATRLVNVLELGYANHSERGQARLDGYQVTLELPIFDSGAPRIARAEASYQQALARTAQLALEARSQVRESYAAYRSAFDLARHARDELVPLARHIGQENLQRYNGMLLSVFDLLAGAREQVAAVSRAIEAQRDFWLADTELRTALVGGPPAGALPADTLGGNATAGIPH